MKTVTVAEVKIPLLTAEDKMLGEAGTVFDPKELSASPRVAPGGGFLPPMVSYAQNFEDVMLRRALQDLTSGFYVDIGAADPDTDSVTRWFYELGWRGINVEPDPLYFRRLEERRPEDRNLACVIGAANTNVVLNLTRPGGGASTSSPVRLAELTNVRHATTTPIVVPAITLDELFILACDRVIDFLKIDAEGMEDDILGGCSFISQRPRIILAEATLFDSQLPSHQKWEPRLMDKGYRFAWFDGINRFYVRVEDEWRLEFFKVPPCYFDNFLNETLRRHTAFSAHAEAEREQHANELAASRAEIEEIRRENAVAIERQEAALSEEKAKAAGAIAHAEAEREQLANELAASRVEIEEIRRETAVAIERQEAALSEEKVKAAGAAAHAEAEREQLANELAASRAEIEEIRREITSITQRYEAKLAKGKAKLEEFTAGAETVKRELKRTAASLETRIATLLDRKRALRAVNEELARDANRLRTELLRLERENTLVTAARDAAVASSLRWFAAALPGDQDREDPTRRYPVQSRAYRMRCVWLAPGLRRRSGMLTAAGARAAVQENWELAARYYREALDLTANRAKLWVRYAKALMESGKLAEAECAYRKSLELEPRNAEAHRQLGQVLKRQGRTEEATEAYLVSLTLAPSLPRVAEELVALTGSEL